MLDYDRGPEIMVILVVGNTVPPQLKVCETIDSMRQTAALGIDI